jgi:transcriptional regulator GlxA family with amidase domain
VSARSTPAQMPARLDGAAESSIRRVIVLAGAGAEILDVVGPFQVFKTAQSLHAEERPRAAPVYRVEIIALAASASFKTNTGVCMRAQGVLRQVRGAIDTCLVAGGAAVEQECLSRQTVERFRALAERCRRVGAVCTGAFLLARAGLLNGRRATTHWNWCARLAQRYPQVRVEPEPIFVRDQQLYTSAGVTAGMDLALAMVEEDLGSAMALKVARQLVLYLRRPGGQSQFSAALSLQTSDRESFRDLQAWVLEHLDRPLDVAALAQQVAMSPRNFARVFRREMNVTPAKFVERMRVEAARRRLEETRHSLKRIAAECGFGGVSSMRGMFRRLLGISPARYRQHFRKRSGL